MRQEPSSENCRLVYLTRRAYETGEIRLLLRTDNVCAEKDTGWQLLQGSETGLELSNPGNSLLVSVARALEIEPKLAPSHRIPGGRADGDLTKRAERMLSL